MNNQEIIDKINIVLAEEFEADSSKFLPDDLLMDTLQLDSLDLVDVVVLIDNTFGVTLIRKDFVEIKTFQDFYDLIIRKINEK